MDRYFTLRDQRPASRPPRASGGTGGTGATRSGLTERVRLLAWPYYKRIRRRAWPYWKQAKVRAWPYWKRARQVLR
jgi:hypothetical protein